jgi:hypothetical protein
VDVKIMLDTSAYVGFKRKSEKSLQTIIPESRFS